MSATYQISDLDILQLENIQLRQRILDSEFQQQVKELSQKYTVIEKRLFAEWGREPEPDKYVIDFEKKELRAK